MFTEVGSNLLIQAGGKTITLVGVVFANLSSSNMTFTTSILKVGDDSASTIIINDDLAQWLSGTAGADALYGLGGADTLEGGAGDDWLDGRRAQADRDRLSRSSNSHSH